MCSVEVKAMSKIEINLTLEGEDAMRVLRALVSKGTTLSVPPTTTVVEETPEKEPQTKPAYTKRLMQRWSNVELDYLELMQRDYYKEHGVVSFRHIHKEKIESEFFSLCGVPRTIKSMNVRLSIMRQGGNEAYFPEGKKKVKRKKTPKNRS